MTTDIFSHRASPHAWLFKEERNEKEVDHTNGRKTQATPIVTISRGKPNDGEAPTRAKNWRRLTTNSTTVPFERQLHTRPLPKAADRATVEIVPPDWQLLLSPLLEAAKTTVETVPSNRQLLLSTPSEAVRTISQSSQVSAQLQCRPHR